MTPVTLVNDEGALYLMDLQGSLGVEACSTKFSLAVVFGCLLWFLGLTTFGLSVALVPVEGRALSLLFKDLVATITHVRIMSSPGVVLKGPQGLKRVMQW